MPTIGELVAEGVTLESAEKRFRAAYIMAAMKRERGNCLRAAERLGVHRNTIWRTLTMIGKQPSDVGVEIRAGLRKQARNA